MKKYLLLACVAMVTALYVSGCACGNEERVHETKVRLALDSAARSEQKETTFFLGFTVGMTESQVVDHLRRLHREGKVYLEGDRFTYDYTHSNGLVTQIIFSPQYYDGGLYVMDYYLSGKTAKGLKNVFLLMLMDFKDTKEADGFQLWERNDSEGNTVYYEIKDNLIVSFYNHGYGSVMSYEDAPTARKAEQSKKEEEEKKWKEAASEF